MAKLLEGNTLTDEQQQFFNDSMVFLSTSDTSGHPQLVLRDHCMCWMRTI
ncbi:hypothetical protein [Secundilactobacillus paracollinoides]|nr:hypothetical protein [Secundilactobacillus paracollinoides]